MTPAALAVRLREACLGEPATLAARTFGGPQAAVLAAAPPDTRSCLAHAFARTRRYVGTALRIQARLKAVPEQQILSLSNQNDGTQVSTTFFASLAQWVNALRAGYCANQARTGLRYFFPAELGSIHTMLRSDLRYTGLLAGGVSVRDFVAAAVADPDGVVDRVDEGTFVTDVPGVLPFACLGG